MLKINFLFKKLINKLLGFSVVGIITTLLTIVLIYIVIHLFDGPLVLSYILIYTAAIVLSYILNMLFVFKNHMNFKGALIYFSIYLSGMGLGALFLDFIKDAQNIPDVWKAYLAIPITFVWNFGLSFLIFNSPEHE